MVHLFQVHIVEVQHLHQADHVILKHVSHILGIQAHGVHVVLTAAMVFIIEQFTAVVQMVKSIQTLNVLDHLLLQ